LFQGNFAGLVEFPRVPFAAMYVLQSNFLLTHGFYT